MNIKTDFYIYYINMNNRQDRDNSMKILLKTFDQFNINYERIEAIDGRDLDINELISNNVVNNDYMKTNYKRDFKRGEVGCVLSHIKSWKKFLESDYKYGIFFEDDIEINKEYFDIIFPNILTELPEHNFDWCYLGMNGLGFVNDYYKKIISKYFYETESISYGCHAYILSREGANKILKYYDKVKIYHPLDFNFRVINDYPINFNEKFNFIMVKPDFLYYKDDSYNKENVIWKRGREFIIYSKDWSDSDTSKIK